MTDSWNYNLSEAPKSCIETVIQEGPNGKPKKYKKLIPIRLLCAEQNGDVVNISYYIPQEDRWNMYAKSTPPLCWKYLDKHPNYIGED